MHPFSASPWRPCYLDKLGLKIKFVENGEIMSKAINQEMYNYFMELNDAEKRSVVQMIKTFLLGRKQQSGQISIDQYNKEIDEAMKRMDEGRFVSQEDLEKEADKW
ncbi:hypothetical protein D3H65_11290 [Paraflavitalea soli]|uniref:Uncharacterized protein n=2 Tax=Paraflavitalea soli TaxID=2315862 RepID=A0A3B7MK20_9BACT|nr:hypothetical protein D3H65_11290 [Paraflavitalea soli]